MLEGAVARLLNQLLGKYVVDLDTENLNVGIFSGHVQLTDLKLKTEALYELKLPVEVIAGTISKIWLQIPWTSLWSQPVVVNIEDVHIIAGPIVNYDSKYDEEKNKRLLRAFKKKIIQDLNDEYELIGGPALFREYLLSSVINNLQLNLTNVHIRYEDRNSTNYPLATGICIGSITAESTNNKWKPCKQTKNAETSFYLVKIEAFSIYWNPKYKPIDWDLPSQYYNWRNSMSNSLKNYSLNDENFDFLLRPMTIKIKTTIQKTLANNNSHSDKDNDNIAKISSDVIIQDCNLQITKLQYQSILATYDSLQRMYTSWNYLSLRPNKKIISNNNNGDVKIETNHDTSTIVKSWWKYAYLGCLEQRVKPYYWNRIRTVRENYRNYCEIYKKILLNPKDTELKLDLQKYEDKLSVINIVIARQHTRLMVHSTSLSEKSFWDILPSPERTLLCDKIGFAQIQSNERPKNIEHNYNFRTGNVSLTLYDSGSEIFVVTLTQLITSFQPNFVDKSFLANVKIEALIVDGINNGDEPLITLISSQHLHNSPAYFMKFNFEKTPSLETNCDYRLNGILEPLEIIYNEMSLKALKSFLNCNEFNFNKIVSSVRNFPIYLFEGFKDKLKKKWDINLDVKVPHLVLPENGSLQANNNLLVIDYGHVIINTELIQDTDILDNATQMELEEQLYSRLYFKCDNTQLLFCDCNDNWKDARKEKDTDLHLISKFNYSAIYGSCVKQTKTLPKEKFNLNITSIKCNFSERKIGKLLNYLNSINSLSFIDEEIALPVLLFIKDRTVGKLSLIYLNHVQNVLNVKNTFVNKSRRSKQERSGSILIYDKRKMSENLQKENMNEVWARTVDLPGLEDNISPNNNIDVLLRFVINEFQFALSRSSDRSDRDYLTLRLGCLTMDVALMTYGPAFQLNVNSILLTDKLHTTPSGQYLDLIHSPVPSTTDVFTVLYRKVAANCPDFWTHFHAVETSLVADFGTLNVMLHQEAIHTIVKYTRYINDKIKKQISNKLLEISRLVANGFKRLLKSNKPDVPVPPGSVKFSHSARLSDLNVRICDSDFDLVNVHLSGLEMDFLFKANERFVFRSFLSNLNVEHLSDITLYPKVCSTDEDKVFEIKYVRYANLLQNRNEISSSMDETVTGGSLKFHLGQIHVVFLYKLIVQLHRFIMNLELYNLVDDLTDYVNRKITLGMESFKSNTKIHLAINIKGPIVLFPQKSSSPNLVVFDAGSLNVENFFKEYPNECVENILLKLDGITITRGVMTLTSTLVMQEVIVEPLSCHVDIKRYVPTSSRTAIKRLNWEIDGVMDVVQITLGQRDLSTLLSIYTDNIGEGKLLDLFPASIKTSTPAIENDETVKTLEAFFCEPKQKDINVKFSFEGLSLLLFFDSGELLSSPIRDLNHGLCKLDVCDIAMSFAVYTDKSLDGKLSTDTIQIEEIGPDANIYDKSILQSPVDDNKNNNCHITVNKPPIIDITFHKNRTKDKSIDIIVGRLNLSLSVPFCEKLAMFVLECIPKDIVGDSGIVNHGYVGDNLQETNDNSPKSSLTIALRVNRPEFTFVVETTSNKKRYFITKTEILLDYSRHVKMLNFVISLSGLHSLFYDYNLEPYTILKQCDVEISKSFNEEKGTKVTAVVSSIYVQICNRIVYNINDILNDIIEHFKVPENETRKDSTSQDIEVSKEIGARVASTKSSDKKVERKKSQDYDLWSPCKIINYETFNDQQQPQQDEITESYQQTPAVLHEIFLLQKTEIVVIMELEDVPVLLLKATVEATMYDWSSLLNSTSEFTIQGNYFNENLQQWEPFIDPIVVDNNEYKPWELLIKIFQDKSTPMLTSTDNKFKKESRKSRKNITNVLKGDLANDGDLEDEEDQMSEDEMVYLEPSNTFLTRNTRIKTSLSTFLDDTDSENEDGTIEKLAAAISDLFTGDWNESDCSESDYSSEGDEDTDENVLKSEQEHQEESTSDYKKSIYVLIDSKETLNLTITPAFLKILNELFTVYSNKTLSIINNSPITVINLINDIGPKTKVELYEKKTKEVVDSNGGNNDDSVLLCSKTYENQDSCGNSPTKSIYYSYDGGDASDEKDSYTEDISKIDIEMGYDDESTSSLLFPSITTPILYEKINRNHLKIHIPGFQTMQTICPKRLSQKLIKLHPIINNQLYYVVVKHEISKRGRNVTVNSPLQIRNETCFALSILYQPSALQQLNLEPVGDVTNPFETTMRIAVLEPHEQYNVPLFIAYHSKLFIQPAYAEGHYVSDNGIWWKDLATDLDVAHNFHCNPKSKSNLEVFSLRLMLKRNVEMKTSHLHSIPNYVINFLPPLILHNFLPYSLEVQNVYLKQQMKIEPGEQTSIYSLNLSKDQKLLVKITYSNLVWSGMLNLTSHLDEKIVNLTSENDNKNLSINVKTDREGSCNLFFYTPYWIVNKTLLPLYIRGSSTNIVHETTTDEILLFTYKRHGKQMLNMKVYESDWSNDFSLDCLGTTGLIVCKDNERKKRYAFLLSIRLSELCPKFTKLIFILPNFIVVNNTSRCLRFMEHNEKTDLWIDLNPNQSTPFWPETTSMQMYVKYRDSKLNSQAFYISTTHHTVLRLDKGGAMCVDVTGGKNDSFYITFNEYKEGDAPVFIKNLCPDLFLKVQQQGQSQVTLLSPFNGLMYTWDDPTKPRQLLWNVYNNKGSGFLVDISKDSYGEEKINFHSISPNQLNQTAASISSSDDSDTGSTNSETSIKTALQSANTKKVRRCKIIIYWICYRNGQQRTLLFTQQQRTYNQLLKEVFMEHCDIDCLLSLSGVGVSIFTEQSQQKEHVYVSLVDVPAIWEVNVGHKWKQLTLELASWIEDKYKLNYKKCQLKDYVQIDFEKMFMVKPFFAELKRTYNPALYVQYRKSNKHKYYNGKVQQLQIDNKATTGSASAVVLTMLPKLPIDTYKNVTTPLFEVSCLKFNWKNCDVYKNLYCNVSDFYLNVDCSLITNVANLLLERFKLCQDELGLYYRKDMINVRMPMKKKDKPTTKSIIENVHLSQIAVQVYVSNVAPGGTTSFKNCQLTNFLHYFFPSNLSAYMPAEGLRHKITPLEQIDIKANFTDILREMWDHVCVQFLQQYYSQVMGLQVLVNPYANQIIPSNEKIPNEGEKMANITLFACRCLLGHLNMSSAALEQCVMDIFTNQTIENIQRIRRHGSYQKSSGIPKNVTSISKHFNPGVILALNQIMVKNTSANIQCDGERFFKGTGKALLSLITRHPDEKSDSVHVAIEALKRAVLLGEPVMIHQRLTRYSNSYLGLKPFSMYESMGQHLLETLANCRFNTDNYWAHAIIDKQGKSIVIVTLEHILKINKYRLWGSWDLEWSVDLDEVVNVPKVTSNELIINMRQGENNLNNTTGKLTILGDDKETLTWLKEKIGQAIVASMEDKSWAVQ